MKYVRGVRAASLGCRAPAHLPKEQSPCTRSRAAEQRAQRDFASSTSCAGPKPPRFQRKWDPMVFGRKQGRRPNAGHVPARYRSKNPRQLSSQVPGRAPSLHEVVQPRMSPLGGITRPPRAVPAPVRARSGSAPPMRPLLRPRSATAHRDVTPRHEPGVRSAPRAAARVIYGPCASARAHGQASLRWGRQSKLRATPRPRTSVS
eukprot:gene17657-biopygen5992